MSSRLSLNSFFAGIGGFDLGFERAGFVTGFQCEIDAYCCNILQKHWPRASRVDDIRTVIVEKVPEASVWAGGFPCQDVSVARGSMGRDGLKGARSGLFHQFLELITSALPKVVLLENVTGLLNSHNGLDFELILKSLTNLGYGVAWRILNSRYFGVPQSRPRVFICAWYGSVKKAIRCLYEPSISPWPGKERPGFLTPCDRTTSGAIVPEVAYCLAATSGRHTGTDWSRSYVSYFNRVRRLTPVECEGLQGFPRGWSIPTQECKISSKDLDSTRYEALGNAVCVPVTEWIAGRIKTELLAEPSREKESATLLDSFPTDMPKNLVALGELNRACGKFRWSSGGYAWDGNCILTSVSPAPSERKIKYFVDILEQDSVASAHYLSSNAAEGILRRVRGQKRSLFAPLEEALQRLADEGKPITDEQAMPDIEMADFPMFVTN